VKWPCNVTLDDVSDKYSKAENQKVQGHKVNCRFPFACINGVHKSRMK